MKEYGYINEGGYLRSMTVEDYAERYFDKDGQVKTRTISEEEQIEKLTAAGWKPVDAIDHTRLKADDGYIVRVMPYDNGDCIRFKYEQVRDIQQVKNKIEALKNSLTDSDYKIIKCYEAYMAGEQLPYDFVTLRTERQQMRNQINVLESQIAAI